jgi:hypothetical protein
MHNARHYSGMTMLTVKTYVAPAGARGLGLFAAESIRAGETWWIYSLAFDRVIPQEQVNALPALQREFLNTYGTHEPDGSYYVCLDNARFTNHSDKPNTANIQDATGCVVRGVAARDITAGEEITVDYREICSDCAGGLDFEVK